MTLSATTLVWYGEQNDEENAKCATLSVMLADIPVEERDARVFAALYGAHVAGYQYRECGEWPSISQRYKTIAPLVSSDHEKAVAQADKFARKTKPFDEYIHEPPWPNDALVCSATRMAFPGAAGEPEATSDPSTIIALTDHTLYVYESRTPYISDEEVVSRLSGVTLPGLLNRALAKLAGVEHAYAYYSDNPEESFTVAVELDKEALLSDNGTLRMSLLRDAPVVAVSQEGNVRVPISFSQQGTDIQGTRVMKRSFARLKHMGIPEQKLQQNLVPEYASRLRATKLDTIYESIEVAVEFDCASKLVPDDYNASFTEALLRDIIPPFTLNPGGLG